MIEKKEILDKNLDGYNLTKMERYFECIEFSFNEILEETIENSKDEKKLYENLSSFFGYILNTAIHKTSVNFGEKVSFLLMGKLISDIFSYYEHWGFND